jgi:hypothetical protein
MHPLNLAVESAGQPVALMAFAESVVQFFELGVFAALVAQPVGLGVFAVWVAQPAALVVFAESAAAGLDQQCFEEAKTWMQPGLVLADPHSVQRVVAIL